MTVKSFGRPYRTRLGCALIPKPLLARVVKVRAVRCVPGTDICPNRPIVAESSSRGQTSVPHIAVEPYIAIALLPCQFAFPPGREYNVFK